jgi:hypothetical protein
MKYRRKLSKRASKRVFNRGAKIHVKNFKNPVRRGGIRL